MGERTTDASEVQSKEVEQCSDPVPEEETLELPPRTPYQDEVVEFRRTHRNSLQALPMGAGKTRSDLESIDFDKINGPILIICKKSALSVWPKEDRKWLGGEHTFLQITTKTKDRKAAWKGRHHFDFVMCTYEMARTDIAKGIMPLEWALVIMDEAHKLKNRKTQLFKQIKRLSKENQYYLTSGQPARKGPQDMWTLFYFLNRTMFPSYWKYVNTFCHTERGPFGNEIIGPKNVERFREILSDYMIRYTKESVDKYLPEKHRIPVPVQLTDYEERIYQDIYHDMLAMVEGTLVVAPTVLAKIVRIRQLLCCPKLLDPEAPDGSAIDTIVEMMEQAPHCVIFVPFAKAIPFIEARLRKEGYKDIFTLRGGTEPEEVESVQKGFTATKGITICSILFAESFDLDSTDTAFFCGFDFSPDTNAQAEDRLRRKSSEHKHLSLYYMLHSGTYAEDMLEMLNDKQTNVNMILKQPKRLLELMKPRET